MKFRAFAQSNTIFFLLELKKVLLLRFQIVWVKMENGSFDCNVDVNESN